MPAAAAAAGLTPMWSAMSWMTLLSSVEAVALTLLRIENPKTLLYRGFAASTIYGALVVPLLIKTLQYEGIGIVNFIWNVFSTIIMFTIGVYIFKEKIESLQLIGVVLSLAGLGLILMGGSSGSSSK